MAQILKVDEWKSPAGIWRVADVHTWTNWRALAGVFDVDYDGLIELLTSKYKATIDSFITYDDKRDSLLIFHFNEYANAHKFKLDVNRIARKKNYLI